MARTIIMGIDPGSRYTGYGIISDQQGTQQCLVHGCIATPKTTMAERLFYIYSGIIELIMQYAPLETAIERVFLHKNVQSALTLGQARGAALVAVAAGGLPVSEYSPRQVKQTVVGYGAADKSQIQHMVCRLLKLDAAPREDAADALALAICHSQFRRQACLNSME